MNKVRLVQGDLAYQGEFSSPAFDLVGSFLSLLTRLYARMAKFGVRPADLKLESGQSLAESALLCALHGLNAQARIRVERVEANFLELRRVTQDQVLAIILEAIGAVQELSPQLAFKTHGIVLSLHGVLEGITFEDFIQRYTVKAPDGLGPPVGSGVVYYYGPETERDNSSVVLDKSLVVSGGLYLRMNLTINGTKVSVTEVHDKVSAYFNLLVKKLDLEITWGG